MLQFSVSVSILVLIASTTLTAGWSRRSLRWLVGYLLTYVLTYLVGYLLTFLITYLLTSRRR